MNEIECSQLVAMISMLVGLGDGSQDLEGSSYPAPSEEQIAKALRVATQATIDLVDSFINKREAKLKEQAASWKNMAEVQVTP